MLLFIDNYDSFTYNLVQYFETLGQTVLVKKNDQLDLSDIIEINPDAIVIGPGPGTPAEAGITLDIIHEYAGKYPILGICLGHQAIGEAFGGKVIQAGHIMHGRLSEIYHNNQGIFNKIPSPFKATRYHSLVIDKTSLPNCLDITAHTISNTTNTQETNNITKDEQSLDSYDNSVNHKNTEIDEIMGMKHQTHPIEGVQFHPESILTEYGYHLLNNFLIKYVLDLDSLNPVNKDPADKDSTNKVNYSNDNLPKLSK